MRYRKTDIAFIFKLSVHDGQILLVRCRVFEGSAQGLPVRLALGGHKNPGGIIVEAVHEPSLEAALPGLH